MSLTSYPGTYDEISNEEFTWYRNGLRRLFNININNNFTD